MQQPTPNFEIHEGEFHKAGTFRIVIVEENYRNFCCMTDIQSKTNAEQHLEKFRTKFVEMWNLHKSAYKIQ